MQPLHKVKSCCAGVNASRKRWSCALPVAVAINPWRQGFFATSFGAQLGLAPNTVSTYRARILEKTGTKNDVELALYAERHARKPADA